MLTIDSRPPKAGVCESRCPRAADWGEGIIIDLFSRQVVGWSMQTHMKAELVTDALRIAWFRRRPEGGVIVHSDRGSQYCSGLFQYTLKATACVRR